MDERNIGMTILLEIGDSVEMGDQRKKRDKDDWEQIGQIVLIVELLTNKKINFGVKSGLN